MIVLKKLICIVMFILFIPVIILGALFATATAGFTVGMRIMEDLSGWLTEDLH